MSKTSNILQKIAPGDRFIDIHEAKIQQELKQPNPDQGQIRHCESEIRGLKRLAQAMKEDGAA